MEIQGKKTSDIARLCEMVGLDSSAYISFEHGNLKFTKQPVITRRESEPKHGIELLSTVGATAVPAALTQLRSTFAPLHEESNMVKKAKSSSAQLRVAAVQVGLLSLAGGTGKTCLAAVMGRVLLRRGYSVLLADNSPFNAMHSLFGIRKESANAVSFVTEDGQSGELPILSRFHEGQKIDDYEPWYRMTAGNNQFTLLDGMADPLASGRDLLNQGARILILVLPEMMQAMAAMHIEKALGPSARGHVHYLLNRFDSHNSHHLQVRTWMRNYFENRLLPFEIAEDPMIPEIAAGVLTIGVAPVQSPARRNVESLADWFEASLITDQQTESEVGQ